MYDSLTCWCRIFAYSWSSEQILRPQNITIFFVAGELIVATVQIWRQHGRCLLPEQKKKKKKKREELTLAELHVEKHLRRGRWQPRSEPDRGGGAHQQRKQRSLSRRAAGFCCAPAGWSLQTLRLPPSAWPVKSYTAAVSANTRWKVGMYYKKKKKKPYFKQTGNRFDSSPALYSKIHSVTFSCNPYMFSVLAWKLCLPLY